MSILDLDDLVRRAHALGASDLHLEPGLPATVRIRGALQTLGEPIAAAALATLARRFLAGDDETLFAERQSADLARVVAGVRCRFNVMTTSRGTGLAIRLLSETAPSLARLNLHPDLAGLVDADHGLVLITGPTGSGKSSTLAALLEHINRNRSRVIVTIEQPIEFDIAPRQSFLRRREVGRDTPSFEQALRDAMREDIDVLMVGEMRTPETMRLTLDACETGHLVLATMHASTTIEALQRVVSAFPAMEQPSVCSQLADVLRAVVSQRLQFRDELGIRVPECEILRGTNATRGVLRQGQLFRLRTALETGGQEGNWTLDLYRRWLNERADWYVPERAPADFEPYVADAPAPTGSGPAEGPDGRGKDVFVIEPPPGESVADILSELDED